MKKIFFTSLLMTSLIFISLAQGSTKPKKLNIKAFSNDVCNCIDKVFGNLHTQLKQMFMDLANVGEEKAKANLEKYLENNPNEKEKIEKSMEDMGDVGKEMDEKCADLKQKYGDIDMTEAQKNEIITFLDKKKQCKLAAAVMKAGLLGK